MNLTALLARSTETKSNFPRILAVYMEGSASSYYRIQVPMQTLHEAGYPVSWGPIEAFEDLPLDSFDMLVFLRTGTGIAPHITETIAGLRAEGRIVVADYDDDVLNIPEFNPGHIKDTSGIKAVLATVDGVIVTNTTLRQSFAPFCRNIVVMPNYVQTPLWPKRPILNKNAPVVGLFGSPSHVEDWKLVVEPMRRIRKEFPLVHFLLAGFDPDYLYDIRTDYMAWLPINMYPELVNTIDIGLCPVIDDHFNRCKTPIKAYEYALAGAAVVASPTLYKETVQGRGRIARTEEDWYQGIRNYIVDPMLRGEHAHNLAVSVIKNRAAHTHVAEIAQVYRSVWQAAKANKVEDTKWDTSFAQSHDVLKKLGQKALRKNKKRRGR